MAHPNQRLDFSRPASSPVHRLEIDQEVTCPICGTLSQRSTFDARLGSMEEKPTEDVDKVSYDVQWTVINGWLDCGHQVIRDGAVVQDWRALDEDVSMHTMAAFAPHADGRFCSYHSRLSAWTFEGTKECLRTHPSLDKRPAGGTPC